MNSIDILFMDENKSKYRTTLTLLCLLFGEHFHVIVHAEVEGVFVFTVDFFQGWRNFGRPILGEVRKFTSVLHLQLVLIDELKHLILFSLFNELNFPLGMLWDEFTSQIQKNAKALGIVDEGLLHVSGIVQINLGQEFEDLLVGDFCQFHILQIHDQNVFLYVIWNHHISHHHYHQKVYEVIGLLHAHIVIQLSCPNYNNWPH